MRNSHLSCYFYASIVTLTKQDSAYANAASVADLSGATATSQMKTIWYDNCLPQIPEANILPAQADAPIVKIFSCHGGQNGIQLFLQASVPLLHRNTPMMVQAAFIYYGAAMLFNLHMETFRAALLIVSINTGAYMAETVRGGILCAWFPPPAAYRS